MPRDHPLKTLAFFRGEGSQICQICQRIVVKKCRQRGVGGQKSLRFADVFNGWSLGWLVVLSQRCGLELENLQGLTIYFRWDVTMGSIYSEKAFPFALFFCVYCNGIWFLRFASIHKELVKNELWLWNFPQNMICWGHFWMFEKHK